MAQKEAPDTRFPQYVYRKNKQDETESKVVKNVAEFSAAIKAGYRHADDFHGIEDHGTNPLAKPKSGAEEKGKAAE